MRERAYFYVLAPRIPKKDERTMMTTTTKQKKKPDAPKIDRITDRVPRDRPTAPLGAARLIDRNELLDKVPLSYPNIWSKMRAGTFPRSRAVGDRVLWVEAEVDAWIAALPMRRLKGDADAEVA
jgi:predicted DNA-binding transcriptional regulator AlpA